MRPVVLVLALIGFFGPAASAAAETIFQMAENNVPVAMIEITRAPQFTQVRLQARADLKSVCWFSQGPNSPYLVAEGRRYRFVSGEMITDCPQNRGYASGETMVLRFQPLPENVHQFSLVEGEGGENQMADPKSSRSTFWNFLRLKLN